MKMPKIVDRVSDLMVEKVKAASMSDLIYLSSYLATVYVCYVAESGITMSLSEWYKKASQTTVLRQFVALSGIGAAATATGEAASGEGLELEKLAVAMMLAYQIMKTDVPDAVTGIISKVVTA
jgi:hypothetical protein